MSYLREAARRSFVISAGHMLNDVKAVFFDAGQTILDPAVPIGVAYLREAAAVGVTLPEDGFLAHMDACWTKLRSPGTRDDLTTSEQQESRMWHRFTAEVASPFPDLASRHEAWLARLVSWFDAPSAWRPMDGAAELLADLKRTGRTVGVVSNWHAALHGILEGTGFEPLLDLVVVSSQVGYRKPHPAPFERALELARVDASAALHVGDSFTEDVIGARRAGLKTLLLSADPGHHGGEETIASLRELRPA